MPRLSASQLVNSEETLLFQQAFADIVQVLLNDSEFEFLGEASRDLLVKTLKYNVMDGKLIRGKLVVSAFKHFAPNASEEDVYLSYILGWIIEMYQGFAIVIDDIIDGSEYRRGKLCWYRRPSVGPTAVCDANVIMIAAQKILRHYFGSRSAYGELCNVVEKVVWISLLGESLDARIPAKYRVDQYTYNLHRSAVKGKTSTYTFYFPIAMAMAMAGVSTPKLDEELMNTCMEIGYYYNVQDDYLDVFGDPKIMGKVGTDIQDGKCTWIIIKAMEVATPVQRQIIMENFSKTDTEKAMIVKSCLTDVGVPDLFQSFEVESRTKILRMIDNLSSEAPAAVFRRLFATLTNRQC